MLKAVEVPDFVFRKIQLHFHLLYIILYNFFLCSVHFSLLWAHSDTCFVVVPAHRTQSNWKMGCRECL
jgi:hypothetical protein